MTTDSDRSDDGQQQILERVRDLIGVERSLREAQGDSELPGDEERARLAEVERELDQCWDLLRQRRAKIEYGEDPDEARLRPSGEVQQYLS